MRIVGITGGVDTHADTHVASAIDHNGGLLGIESFPADQTGFEELLGWLVGFGPVIQVGVEGTGSWGVGLTRFLTGQDIIVVEVDRPNRQKRRKVGRSTVDWMVLPYVQITVSTPVLFSTHFSSPNSLRPICSN